MCIIIGVTRGTLLGRTLEGAVLVALYAKCFRVFSLQRVPYLECIPYHRDWLSKIVAHAALRVAVWDMIGGRRPVMPYRIVTYHAVFYGYDFVRDAGPH